MTLVDRIKNAVPQKVRPFLFRAIILVVSWELVYNFVLKPWGTPDNQLTYVVQLGAIELLSLFYAEVRGLGNTIIIEGEKAVGIARQCNGLELIVLYVGFIICLPSTIKRMLVFSVSGTLVIYILNIIRAALLAAMYHHDHSLTDFAHHYVFKIAIYAVVFLGWVLYMKNPGKNAAAK